MGFKHNAHNDADDNVHKRGNAFFASLHNVCAMGGEKRGNLLADIDAFGKVFVGAVGGENLRQAVIHGFKLVDVDFGVARIHRNAQHGAHRQRNRQRRNQMHMLVLQPSAQRLVQHRVRAFNQAIRHQNAHKQHHKMKMQHAKQHQHGNRQRNQKRLACVVACGGGAWGDRWIGGLGRGGIGGIVAHLVAPKRKAQS